MVDSVLQLEGVEGAGQKKKRQTVMSCYTLAALFMVQILKEVRLIVPTLSTQLSSKNSLPRLGL